MNVDLLIDFWDRIDISGGEDACWTWTKYRLKAGYGRLQCATLSKFVDGVYPGMQYAHRISWILTFGPIENNLCVLHRCDNPPCCNPEHLFLGTKIDNIVDRDAKGRHRSLYGADSSSSKLTIDQVREIRSSSLAQRALATKFGVGQTAVANVRKGKTWKGIL